MLSVDIRFTLLAFILALAFGVGQASAAILAEDPFDYTLGTTVQGNGSGADAGWSGGWSLDFDAGAGNGGAASEIVANLEFGSLVTSGNAAQFSVSSGGSIYTRIHSRSFDSSANFGNRFWQSFLYRRTSDGARPNQFDIENGSSEEYNTHFNRQSDQIRESGSTVADPLNIDTTYLVIARRTGNGTVNAVSTLWILDEAQLDAIAPNGVRESELDGLTSAQYTVKVESDPVSSDGDADSGDRFDILNQADNGQTSTFTFDELRFADAAQDAIHVIPLPSPLVLGLGVLGLAITRRRFKTAP